MSIMPTWALITILVCAIVAIISGIVVGILWTRPKAKDKKCRKSIENHSFIPSEDLLKFWQVDDSHPYGYQFNDQPGCYVLTTYVGIVSGEKQLNSQYTGVYVGASDKMLADARAQIRGRGVEEIFKDLKLGKSAYIRFYACDVSEMEENREKLIEQYNAMLSYNKVKVVPKKKKKKRH